MLKRLLIAVLALIVLGGIWYVSSQGDTESQVVDTNGPVATVDGTEISRESFDAFKTGVILRQGIDVTTLTAEEQAQLDAQVIDTLIAQEILAQAVAQANVTVTDENIDAQIETIKGQFEDDNAFQEALDVEGITESELRDRVQNELITQTFLEQELRLSEITATDEEIETAYEQISAEGDVPAFEEVRDQVELLVVQQKQQERINAFVAELQNDADVEVFI